MGIGSSLVLNFGAAFERPDCLVSQKLESLLEGKLGLEKKQISDWTGETEGLLDVDLLVADKAIEALMDCRSCASETMSIEMGAKLGKSALAYGACAGALGLRDVMERACSPEYTLGDLSRERSVTCT